MIKPLKITAKLIFLLLIVFLSNTNLNAQDYYGSSYSQKRVSLGITFSPNLSWLRYGTGAQVDEDLDFSYGYGLLSDFALAENYYFATGFLINNIKSTSTLGPDLLSSTYKLQYVEIPFGIKLKSTQRYFRSYYGQFGFTGGFKISGDKSVDGGELDELGSGAKLLRLGLQVGGGIEWQLDHNLSMMTGLSFNNGFTPVLASEYSKPKNSYIAFNFAIFF